MRPSAARSSPDLALTAGLAFVGLAVALISVGGTFEVVALLPMVLILPGYAACAAFFLPGSISVSLRTVYSLALSFGICALAGTIVQLAVSLDRSSWAIVIFLLTLGTCAIALWRRTGPRGQAARSRFYLPRFDPLAILAVLAAAAIASWAISIASGGAHDHLNEARFAAIWVLPSEGNRAVAIGVANHEGSPTEFQVRATRNGRLLSSWRVSLGQGQRWQRSLTVAPISAARPLLVTLLKEGKPYRQVYLRNEPRP